LGYAVVSGAGRFVQRMRLAAASQKRVTMRQAVVKRLVNMKGEEWSEGQVCRSCTVSDQQAS
jgi:hypothetical protein